MSDKTYPILHFQNGATKAWLYYYNGNFFHPLEIVSREMELRLRRLMQIFVKNNKLLVKTDRANPDYKTKLELSEMGPQA